MPFEYIIGKDVEQFSQRNNLDHPFSSCNVTSIAQSLAIMGVLPAVPGDMQAEDYLATLTDHPIYTEYVRVNFSEIYAANCQLFAAADKETDPVAKKNILKKVTLNREIHQVLAKAVNDWVGYKIDDYHDELDARAILFHMVKTQVPVVISTTFVPTGHVVTLNGIITNQDLSLISHPNEIDIGQIIQSCVRDPYGDVTKGYPPEASGKNVILDWKWFWDHWKYCDSGNKRAHIFTPTR